ncbi:MAG: hypothetical protein ACRYG4_10075, partial [Janthinobacterium lividum]
VEMTATPSMDIQVSSNFERLLYELHDRDGRGLSAAMNAFEVDRRFALPPTMMTAAGTLLSSRRIDADTMTETLRWAHAEAGQLIDPHTGIGLAAARGLEDEIEGPIVTLATAHPAKFPDAVERATGLRPPLPARAQGLFDREERFDTLAVDLGAVESYIAERATPAGKVVMARAAAQ